MKVFSGERHPNQRVAAATTAATSSTGVQAVARSGGITASPAERQLSSIRALADDAQPDRGVERVELGVRFAGGDDGWRFEGCGRMKQRQKGCGTRRGDEQVPAIGVRCEGARNSAAAYRELQSRTAGADRRYL